MTQDRSHQCWMLGIASSLAIAGVIAIEDCSLAQRIKSDNTLGVEKSVFNSNVNIKGRPSGLIKGGAVRGTANSALFHSFEKFSVNEEQRVYFDSPAGIEIILNRVTGNNPSKILGTLGVWDSAKGVLGSADLFLINPKGIIFGPNASLDLKGSFLATTASSLVFDDGKQFSTINPEAPPLLTVSTPLGLQFEGTSGSILTQSRQPGLQVQSGQTLALVGGKITLQGGRLTAPEGRIELGGAGTGQVSLTPVEGGWVLGYKGVQNFMDIELSQESSLGANGSRGGDIQLQGKNVMLADGSRIVAGVGPFIQSSQPSGTLRITASDSVELKGTNSNGDSSALSTSTLGDGNAGNIIIDTERLLLQDRAFISTESLRVVISPEQVISARGSAGDLTVKARKSVEITDNSQITTETSTSGDAGNLRIETGQLIIQDGAQVGVSSAGTGKDAGNVGSIEVVADSILLNNQGKLTATTELGKGGGNISLQNLNLLLLNRSSEISTNAGGLGNGGNIKIDTNLLVALEDSDIVAQAVEGRGGDIQITTSGLFRSPDSEIDASSERGIDGVVEFNTPDVDPDEQVVNLPEEVVDVGGLVAQRCPAGGGAVARGLSEFVVTGRGGLPPTPGEALKSDTVLVDLGTPIVSSTGQPPASKRLSPVTSGQAKSEEPLRQAAGLTENRSSPAVSTNSTDSASAPITEAQGWVIGPNGEVVLTAQAPAVTPHNPGLTSVACHGS